MDSFGIWARVIWTKLQRPLVVSHYGIEISTPGTLLMIVVVVNSGRLVLVHMMMYIGSSLVALIGLESLDLELPATSYS